MNALKHAIRKDLGRFCGKATKHLLTHVAKHAIDTRHHTSLRIAFPKDAPEHEGAADGHQAVSKSHQPVSDDDVDEHGVDELDFESNLPRVILLPLSNGNEIPVLVLKPEILDPLRKALDNFRAQLEHDKSRRAEKDNLRQLQGRLEWQIHNLEGLLRRMPRSAGQSQAEATLRHQHYSLLKDLAAVEERSRELKCEEAQERDEQRLADWDALATLGKALGAANLISTGAQDDTVEQKTPFDDSLLEKLETAGPMSLLDEEVGTLKLASEDEAGDDAAQQTLGAEESLYLTYKEMSTRRSMIRYMRVMLHAAETSCFPNAPEDVSHARASRASSIRARLSRTEAELEELWSMIPANGLIWPLKRDQSIVEELLRDQAFYREKCEELIVMRQKLVTDEQTSMSCSRLFEVNVELDAFAKACETATSDLERLDPEGRVREDVEDETPEANVFANKLADQMLCGALMLLDEAPKAERKDSAMSHALSERCKVDIVELQEEVARRRKQFYEARIRWETCNDHRLPWFCCANDQASASSETSSATSQSSCSYELETPDNDSGVHYIEGLPGLALMSKEPIFDRWRYGLGPFADDYPEDTASVWGGETGDCIDSISVRERLWDDPTDQHELRRWQYICSMSSPALRNVLDESLSKVDKLLDGVEVGPPRQVEH